MGAGSRSTAGRCSSPRPQPVRARSLGAAPPTGASPAATTPATAATRGGRQLLTCLLQYRVSIFSRPHDPQNVIGGGRPSGNSTGFKPSVPKTCSCSGVIGTATSSGSWRRDVAASWASSVDTSGPLCCPYPTEQALRLEHPGLDRPCDVDRCWLRFQPEQTLRHGLMQQNGPIPWLPPEAAACPFQEEQPRVPSHRSWGRHVRTAHRDSAPAACGCVPQGQAP